MEVWEVLKVFIAPVTVGLMLFAANKFYSAAMLIINHEHQIKSLLKATTEDIPNKMDTLTKDIIHSQTKSIELFASEIDPIKEDVNIIKVDINKLKKHTNYNE
jgi:hypothetical protein